MRQGYTAFHLNGGKEYLSEQASVKRKTFIETAARGRRYIMEGSICKGKAVPLQAWSGPEGSRKLRFPDNITTAQGGGKVVSLTHRPPLPPGNAPGTHFC
jgi:hypothetical protein